MLPPPGRLRSDPWLERLERYFEIPEHDDETPGFRRGCLPGTLRREIASTSDGLRAEIATSFDHWRQAITDAVRSAQRAGEAGGTLDPEGIAGFTLGAWDAVLQAKVQRSASRCSGSAPSCSAAGFDAKRRADHYAIARRGH